jgi:hypothetical protein
MIALERGAQPPSHAVSQADVRQALERHEAATQALRVADRALVVLERTGRQSAEREDAEKLAAALEVDGPRPKGGSAVEAYERQLVDARREASATKIVEARAWEAVRAAFNAHSAELQEMTDKAIQERRSAFLATVDKCEESHRRLCELLPWQTFFGGPDVMGSGVYRPATSMAALAPKRHQLDPTQVLVSDLFGALRSVGAEPPALPEGLNPQAYQSAGAEGQLPQPPAHIPLARQGVSGPVVPVGGPSHDFRAPTRPAGG